MDIPRNEFHPLDVDEDLFLFIDARSIAAEHRRGRFNDEVVHSGRRRSCHACQERAAWALLAFAGRAQANGWSREQALAYLTEHPATFDSDAIEGTRREKTRSGRLAKPMDAAKGKTYQTAMEAALERGELDIPTPVATDVLGRVIRSVQDLTTPTGDFVDWDRVADDMEWNYETPVWIVWSQIIEACQQVPRAARMLECHVFSWSQHLAAATMVTRDESGDVVDRTGEITYEDSVTTSEVTGFELLVERLVLRLEARSTADRATAMAWARRIVFESYGPADESADLDRLLDLLVSEALRVVRVG